MLPPPTISFTLPSIHDNLVLDCRIYHPVCLAPTLTSHVSEWRKKAAIVAHPYAPLGGCYDDPVVSIIAAEILKQGFIVATLNFRGAGQGHTTWSSKAEQDDYLSIVGFMIYYMHQLCPPPLPFDVPKLNRSDPEIHDLSPIPSRAIPADIIRTLQGSSRTTEDEKINTKPRLLLAGYSYGSLITTLLPPIITSILPLFQNPIPGSAYEEIRLRASGLATQQNRLISECFTAFHNAHSHSHSRGRTLHSEDIPSNGKTRKASAGVRMGGDESLRRSSHDSYRSRGSFSMETQELVRKSVDRVRSIAKRRASPRRLNTTSSVGSSHRSGRPGSASSMDSPLEIFVKPEEPSLQGILGIGEELHVAYLLVSPLQGMIGNLATMWSSQSWRHNGIPKNEMKLTVDPTLAIFADDDVFVSISKLRAWAQKLAESGKAAGESRFEYVVVEKAGHFWHGDEQVRILINEVGKFVRRL